MWTSLTILNCGMLVVFTTVCYKGVRSYGILKISGNPTPLPQQQLHVQVGMLWVEEGANGERAVAVVDLGDAPRWLQPLHARARSPVLLWRAPHLSRRASAPPWLHQQSGYLIAAHSSRRLHEFLTNDTAEVLRDKYFTDITHRKRQDLQLNSQSPITISLSTKSLNWPITNEERVKLRVSEENKKIALEMWKYHQSFRTVILREGINGDWSGLYHDPVPVTRKTRRIQRREIRRDKRNARKPSALSIVSQIQKVIKRRSWNMSGSKFILFVPQENSYSITQIPKFLNLPPHKKNIMGCHYRWLIELRQLLKLQFASNAKLQENEKRSFIHHENDTLSFIFTRVHVMRAIAEGALDFSTISFKLFPTGTTSYDIIPGTFHPNRIVVVVPKAAFLPAWSLPFRVFGARIWLCVGACVAAYALAWRRVAGETWAGSVAAALRAFSSCGGPPQDRVKSLAGRLQLAAALLAAAVVLVAAYQCRLFALISLPETSEEIDTFEQLANSKLKLMGYATSILNSILKPIEGYLSEQELKIRKSLQLKKKIENIETIFESLEQRKRVAALLYEENWKTESIFGHLSENFRTMNGIYEYLPMIKCVRRNWPWLDALNHWELIFRETGMLELWIKDYNQWTSIMIRLMNAKNNNKPVNEETDSTRVFILEDFTPHYQLLTVGLVISTITFFVEYWRGRKSRAGN